MKALSVSDNRQEAEKLWFSKADELRKKEQDLIQKINTLKISEAKNALDEGHQTASDSSKKMGLLIAIAVLMAIGLGIINTKAIANQLNYLKK
jgi:vacuolar-type H+-ATPase subunit H